MSDWSVSRERFAVPEALSSEPIRVHDADILRHGHAAFAVGADRASTLVFKNDGAVKTTAMPEPLYAPSIRMIDSDTALLAYRTSRSDEEQNAWIIDSTGKVLRRFPIGDGVESILRTENFLVVTYFDEGVFGKSRFGQNGLCVFDLQGQFVWGWNDRLPGGASPIDDCYACVWLGEDRIGMCSYTSFELAIIDVRTQAASIHQTPDVLHGCHAITMRDNDWLFRGPYKDEGRQTVFSWRPGTEPQPRLKLAAQRGIRGLRGGRFIAIFDDGADLIDFT